MSPPDEPRRTPRPRTRNVSRRSVDPVRLVAYTVLRTVAERDAYANLVLPSVLRREGLHGRDAAFATELTYGTLRGRGTYDAVIASAADRPVGEIDEPVLDALRLGTHQLLAMRVPAHAGVAASVDLVRAEIGSGAASFANAVLRRVSERDRAAWLELVAPPADREPDAHLAVVHSHPVWIVRAMRDALRTAGRDVGELADLLAADNASPQVVVAALPGLTDPAELLTQGATPGHLSPYAVRISGAPDQLLSVRSRRARVQDEGSQLVAAALAHAPLEGADQGRWLDLCAGPGGKAALLAALLLQRRERGDVPRGAVLAAVEPAEHRVRLVEQALDGIRRQAPEAVSIRQGDGREVGADEPSTYDRVLVDVPCTGLGALRRRPEARWRRTPADVAALAPLQRSLLASALDAVRPGGVVAFVTCSPHPAETRLVVEDVLRRRPDIVRIDAVEPVRAAADGRQVPDLGSRLDVQLWPHVHGTDAMYLALLRRTDS